MAHIHIALAVCSGAFSWEKKMPHVQSLYDRDRMGRFPIRHWWGHQHLSEKLRDDEMMKESYVDTVPDGI